MQTFGFVPETTDSGGFHPARKVPITTYYDEHGVVISPERAALNEIIDLLKKIDEKLDRLPT